MKNFTVSEALITHTGRILTHPVTGEIIEAVIASRPIFREAGWEARETRKAGLRGQADGDAAKRAAARAKREMYRVAMANDDLDLFITLTLDKTKIDRYDAKGAVKRLTKWLDNRAARRGLKYLVVPELHEDGAIHFHGLVNSAACRLVASGHKDRRGRPIYNIADWGLGFTTAEFVDQARGRTPVCRYVLKYVTKQAENGTIAGRYWYHGGPLLHPKVHMFDAGFTGRGNLVEIADAGLTLEYLRPEEAEEMLESED